MDNSYTCREGMMKIPIKCDEYCPYCKVKTECFTISVSLRNNIVMQCSVCGTKIVKLQEKKWWQTKGGHNV